MRRELRSCLSWSVVGALFLWGCGSETSTTERSSDGGSSGSGATGGSSAAGGNPSSAGGTGSAGSAATGSGGTSGLTSGGSSGASGAGNTTSGGSAGSGGTDPGPDPIGTIENGGFWNDVDGNRIEAHGGGFIKVEDTWYWIGEDKSHNSGNFKGVNCYSSSDLQHWKLENAIITRDTAPELDASDRIIERPKVIYNDQTEEYVMWLHWEGQNYAEAEAGVFHSPTVCGDYAYVSSFRPEGNMSRDDTLFKDDDGTAYFISAANENADLVVYELTDDYLDVEREVITLWKGSKREAPAMMKADGVYYLVTSGATGWDPNQAKYATATNIEGPWTELKNIGDGTTYDTQSTYLIPVQGTEVTTYVYAGDRWQDPDLLGSKYIWLPLKLSGTSLSLDYYDAWQINLRTGEWSVNDGYLPQSGWTLLYTDSEETAGENGAAENAFDDSVSTIWHTAYESEAPPHEIQIDLGARYSLDAFRYYPRQDKDDHGIVADYDFYVSEDSTGWGTPVATGTFEHGTLEQNRSPKRVEFTPKVGRYVRFVAKSEIKDEIWSSVAELDVSGTPAP
jgi:hypothetical protein